MDETCPLCCSELAGAAEIGEGASTESLLDCPHCGRLRLDTAARAMVALAEAEELRRIAARLQALRRSGDRATLALHPALFVLD